MCLPNSRERPEWICWRLLKVQHLLQSLFTGSRRLACEPALLARSPYHAPAWGLTATSMSLSRVLKYGWEAASLQVSRGSYSRSTKALKHLGTCWARQRKTRSKAPCLTRFGLALTSIQKNSIGYSSATWLSLDASRNLATWVGLSSFIVLVACVLLSRTEPLEADNLDDRQRSSGVFSSLFCERHLSLLFTLKAASCYSTWDSNQALCSAIPA